MDMIALAIDEAGQDFRSFPDGPLVRAVHDEAVRHPLLRPHRRTGCDRTTSATSSPSASAKAFSRAVKAALGRETHHCPRESDRRFLWLP